MFTDLNFAQIFDSDSILKISFTLLTFAYIIFSFVVFNQVNTMNKIITEDGSSWIIKLISIVNIVAAALLFILILVT